MSRKIKRTVASTLALAMMAGTVSIMPASELTSIVQAVETGATVSVKMFDENQSTTVKPGDEFTVLCDVTDNTDGFSALVAWLSYNQDAFEMTSWNYATDNKRDPVRKNMGDPTDPENTSKYENPDKSIGTIVQLYDSTENLTGDTKLSKITFKVKAEAAAGDYEFSLGGDPVPQNGLKTACQNRNVPDDDDPKETKVIELLPNYVPLKVTVDSGNKPAVTTPAVTTPAPAETTPVPAQTTPAPAQTTVTTTAAEEPVGNGILVKIEDAKAEAGDEVELNVVVSNVGTGFSAVQFGYDMDASFKVTDAISDFGKWTVGKEERAAQFLEKNGNNITKECTLGQIYVDIPKGTPDGKYPVKLTNFKGSTYSTADKKQLTLEADAFSTVVGYIIVGDVPEETTPAETTTAKPAETTPVSSEDPVGDGIVVKFKDTNVNAGEEAEISVMVSNAAAGFSAVQFGYDMDASFKITDAISDFGKWTIGKEERAAQFLEKNGNNITKDCELGTIYVEVPKGTPDGKYPVKLTNFKGSRYSTEEKKQLTLEADAFSTVVGYIIVGDVPAETTPAETTTAKPAETTPAETTTAKPAETTPAETTTAKPAETTPAQTTTAKPAETTPAETTTAKPAETTPVQTTPAPVETTPAVTTPAEPAAKGIKISASNVEDAKPGDEVKVEILAENVGKGFSAVQFTYDMEKTFVVSDAISDLGKWTVGKKERALQFLQKDGNNITSDGAFGEVYIKIPENAKPGKYEIKLSGFKGSVYDKDANKQLTLENDSFETVTAYIVVKEGTPAETTTAKPAETTPAASETTPAATTTAKPAETTPAASETTPAASETTPAATTTAKPAETTPAASETTPAVSETTPAATTTTVQQPEGPVIGDVDDNGVVNTRDIVALKRYLLLVDDEAPKNGDLNGDKKIDSIDLVHLLRIFLK